MKNNVQTQKQSSKKETSKKEPQAVNYGGLRVRSMAASSYDIWSGN